MNVIAPPLGVSDHTNAGVSAVQKLLNTWFGLCEDYRQRERHDAIEREPSPAELDRFRRELKWLLRAGRQLQSLVEDPDYPVSDHGEQIAWRLEQLEDSWEGLNNPLSQAEADALLRQYFPNDPLAAKLLAG